MKAVLVIDMPKNCDECRLNIEGVCSATDERIYSIRCPLKQMPQRQTTDEEKSSLEYIYEADTLDEFQIRGTSYLYGHIDGWNACLDEFTGETAENKYGM